MSLSSFTQDRSLTEANVLANAQSIENERIFLCWYTTLRSGTLSSPAFLRYFGDKMCDATGGAGTRLISDSYQSPSSTAFNMCETFPFSGATRSTLIENRHRQFSLFDLNDAEECYLGSNTRTHKVINFLTLLCTCINPNDNKHQAAEVSKLSIRSGPKA